MSRYILYALFYLIALALLVIWVPLGLLVFAWKRIDIVEHPWYFGVQIYHWIKDINRGYIFLMDFTLLVILITIWGLMS